MIPRARTPASPPAQARIGPVHVLDLFGIAGQPSACFIPLAAFDLAEDVATLADSRVFDPPGAAGAARWNEEARP